MLNAWAGPFNVYQRTITSFFDLYADIGKAALDAFTAGIEQTRETQGNSGGARTVQQQMAEMRGRVEQLNDEPRAYRENAATK